MAETQRMSQSERTDLSDQRMLDVAVKLIIERGPDKTTLREVGELAGYSRGLAGYRFGSKAGLFEFIVRSIGEYWLRELTRVTANRIGIDAICAATDEHLRFCREAPDRVRAFYLLWFESVSPSSGIKQVVASIHDRRRQDVAQWIGLAVSAGDAQIQESEDAIAGQFGASIVGIVYHWLQHPDDLEEVAALHDGLKQSMRLALGVVH